MSSQAERGGFQINLDSIRFEVEHVGEMKHGMWFPLSGMLDDMYSPEVSPTSQQMYPVIRTMLDGFEGDVGIRGSTAIYKLLNVGNIERRGTISNVLRTKLFPLTASFPDSPSARALGELENASDIDLFLPDVPPDDFAKQAEGIKERVAKGFRVKRAKQKEFATSSGQIETNRYVITQDNKKKRVVLHSSKGVVANHIPYCEIEARTEDDKTIATIFWTPGEVSSLPNTFDTRRDPRYSLSWDIASSGFIRREIPSDVASDLQWVADSQKIVHNPGYKRMTNAAGVFAPSFYQKPETDLWFHIPKENLQVLTRPLEVGEGFKDLPVIDQFRLALRAAQKGALAEENTWLGDRYTEGNLLPAISNEALETMLSISVEDFRSEYKVLPEEEREEFSAEMMRYMMTGLFYPGKFIQYCNGLSLFRFFPQLANIESDEWDQVVQKLPDHKRYTKTQYLGTHYSEAKGFDETDAFIQQMRRYNSTINPYHTLFRAMWDVVPDKIPDVDNAFSMLDILLDLDPHQFESKGEVGMLLDISRTYPGEAQFIGWERSELGSLSDERQKLWDNLADEGEKVRTISWYFFIVGSLAYVVTGEKTFEVAAVLTGLLGQLPNLISTLNTIEEDNNEILSSIAMLDEEIDRLESPKG